MKKATKECYLVDSSLPWERSRGHSPYNILVFERLRPSVFLSADKSWKGGEGRSPSPLSREGVPGRDLPSTSAVVAQSLNFRSFPLETQALPYQSMHCLRKVQVSLSQCFVMIIRKFKIILMKAIIFILFFFWCNVVLN